MNNKKLKDGPCAEGGGGGEITIIQLLQVKITLHLST